MSDSIDYSTIELVHDRQRDRLQSQTDTHRAVRLYACRQTDRHSWQTHTLQSLHYTITITITPSLLPTFLYACASWTLTAELERRIQALEMRCYGRLLNISYKDYVMIKEVRNRVQNATEVHDDLLTMVKKWK